MGGRGDEMKKESSVTVEWPVFVSGGKCWKCERGGSLGTVSWKNTRDWFSPTPKPTLHWGAQVITFNEIWASQRHERLQICGLCKNLIFMNLVKEKLRSASYRRYVWVDMHPSVDPWGAEGLYSDWAMHLSSYKEWHGVVCAQVSVKAANISRTSPFASQECQLSESYGSVWPFIVASFFVCSLAWQTNKQTGDSCVDMEPCKLPTLGHLPCTSHAENSRFYVKKERKKLRKA